MKVIPLNCITSHNIPAEKVLDAALEAGLTDVVILGYDSDGSEYFASSLADGADVLWLMERLKGMLLSQDVGQRD